MIFQTQETSGNLGNTQWTIYSFGCLTACYASILEVDVHDIAKHEEYYNSDGTLTNPAKMASDFGGKWDARRDIALHDPVVCETRYTYKNGTKVMHFIVRYQGRIYDPASSNGTPLQNYEILSYRNLWKESEEIMLPKEVTKDFMYTYKGMVLWHVPDPQAYQTYIGSADLKDLPTKENELENQVTSQSSRADAAQNQVNQMTEENNKLEDTNIQLSKDNIVLRGNVEADKTTIKGLQDQVNYLNDELKTCQNKPAKIPADYQKILDLYHKFINIFRSKK